MHTVNISTANLRRVEDTISTKVMRDIVQSVTHLRSLITVSPVSTALCMHSGKLGNNIIFHCFGLSDMDFEDFIV